jgi:hypothetical protein
MAAQTLASAVLPAIYTATTRLCSLRGGWTFEKRELHVPRNLHPLYNQNILDSSSQASQIAQGAPAHAILA